MIVEVVKGTDDEIEFKGFKGRYFYQLVGLVLGLIIVTFITYALGVNSLIFFFVMLGIGIVGLLYIQNKMEVNKKYGHIHEKHSPPKAIIQNQQFFKILKK